MKIPATELTACDIATDGSHAQLSFQDGAGKPISLILPIDCLNQLLMTLPKAVEQAMQRSGNANAIRLIHPLEGFKLEFGQLDGCDDEEQFVLTFNTTNGLVASYSSSVENLLTLGNTILEEAPQHLPRQRLHA